MRRASVPWLLVSILAALGGAGCSSEPGVQLEEIELFADENPEHTGVFDRSLDNRFVTHPHRFVHASFRVVAKRKAQPVVTCTLLDPAGAAVETVEKTVSFEYGSPGQWFSFARASFGPFERGATLGTYRIECEAGEARTAATFQLDRRTRAEVLEQVRPGIVLIRTLAVGERRNPQRKDCRLAPFGHGTGFVIDGDGHVLTNNHVINSCPEDWPEPPLQVTFADGRKVEPEVVGKDPLSDLAVLRVEPADLHPLPFQRLWDSPGGQRGDEVMAIGFAAGIEGEPTVSRGIISGLDRSLDQLGDLVQTDAAINSGNSGGPLINMDGEVVGVNTLSLGRNRGMQDLNFAISGRLAQQIADRLIHEGSVRRGHLGVAGGVSISETEALLLERQGQPLVSGLLILAVERGSPAQLAGLRRCDVIQRFDLPDGRGAEIASSGDYHNALLSFGPGETVFVRYRRYPPGKCDRAPAQGPFSDPVRELLFEFAKQAQGETLTAKVVLD